MVDQDEFDQEFEQSIGFLLNDVSRQMRSRFDRRARALGLTRAQWRVMMFLRRHEGARQSELATLLEVENVTLGRHIDRLEDNGWVQRQRDPADRRAWRLFLAEKSRPILDKLTALMIETRETALAGFSQHDREALESALQRMKTNLFEADNADGSAAEQPRLAVGAAD